MAYNLNISAGASAVIDAGTFSISKNGTLSVSSSNAIQQNVTLQTGSWTSISLGNLTDVAYLSLFNDNALYTASVISLATGSNGSGKLATIQPGLSALIAWSGSLTLYGSVNSGSGPVGILQYYAQQS